jgi:hypothetical protein
VHFVYLCRVLVGDAVEATLTSSSSSSSPSSSLSSSSSSSSLSYVPLKALRPNQRVDTTVDAATLPSLYATHGDVTFYPELRVAFRRNRRSRKHNRMHG